MSAVAPAIPANPAIRFARLKATSDGSRLIHRGDGAFGGCGMD
jgi:hypothetical protein